MTPPRCARRAPLVGAAALLASMFAVPRTAHAGRPDDGGDLFDFDETDVLDALDGPAGLVRVHYSVDGPNVTLLRDADGSGRPDYPEDVAAGAEAVLAFYAAAGFRAPVSESDAGLGPLGGSGAFDFYLIDYGGAADGQFSVDGCDGGVCAGHMLMENDFRGYGYASLAEAIRVLTSHELFHAVQAAYVPELPVWISEGTAVWAEQQYDPGVRDFLAFAGSYLDDTGRSIDRPPAGPVPSFAYGTCLFWEFLSERLGPAVILSLLERSAEREGLDALDAALADQSASLRNEWIAFGAANLATGPRAGGASFYPFAGDVDGLVAQASGSSLHDDNRFYPLAATYYFLEHGGGALWFASIEAPTGLTFSLHAVLGDGEDDELGEMVRQWSPESGAPFEIDPDLPRGSYWLRGTFPERAAQSRKIELCVGDEAAIAPCVPAAPDAGVDAGLPGDVDASADGGTSAGDDADGGGCSCAAAGRTSQRHGPRRGARRGGSALLFTALALIVVRSRRARARW